MRASRANVDVSSVLEAGRELELREAVALPEFGSFDFPTPAEVALRARCSGRALELKGTITAEAAGECARCLDAVRLPLYVEVDERLEPDAPSRGTDGDRNDPLSESNVLVGGELDVADLIRQLIDSALPLVLLCSEDCRGLCAECGQKRDGTCRCPRPE
ncbi:MAG: YceD family protein [Vulcanimicrobiaceae bacterium]